jgi:hypothetical protein
MMKIMMRRGGDENRRINAMYERMGGGREGGREVREGEGKSGW